MKIIFTILSLVAIACAVMAFRRAMIDATVKADHARAHRLVMQREAIHAMPPTDKKAAELIAWNESVIEYAEQARAKSLSNDNSFTLKVIKSEDKTA